MMEERAKGYFEAIEEKADKGRVRKGLITIAVSMVGIVLTVVLADHDIAIILPCSSMIALVVGIIMCAYTKSIFLTGKEYDELVTNMINELSSDAREYLGIDDSEVDEIEPISFEGYRFIGSEKIKKDSSDGIWRSDLYEKVTVFFTRNEIHLYKVFLNTLTGKITETTDVLFYDDVVSVSTKNEMEKIGNNTVEYISFNLVSKGGNNISIALNGNDNRQKSINAMRAMIKEKKTQ